MVWRLTYTLLSFVLKSWTAPHHSTKPSTGLPSTSHVLWPISNEPLCWVDESTAFWLQHSHADRRSAASAEQWKGQAFSPVLSWNEVASCGEVFIRFFRQSLRSSLSSWGVVFRGRPLLGLSATVPVSLCFFMIDWTVPRAMRIRLAISFIERPDEYIPTTSPRRSMDKDIPLPMAKSTSHNGTQPGQSESQSGSHSTALDHVRHDIDQSVFGAPFYMTMTTDERQILASAPLHTQDTEIGLGALV